MNKIEKTVLVTVTVRGEASDADDREVPGEYAVEVVVEGVAEHQVLSEEAMTAVFECALDTFHEKIGIACLDEFEISASADKDSKPAGSEGAGGVAVANLKMIATFLGRLS